MTISTVAPVGVSCGRAELAAGRSTGGGERARVFTTVNGGRTWTEFDAGNFDVVLCVSGACWASGEQGRVAKLTWRH